jgi:predicted alpha/beta-hydrolase family hydrolase
VPTSHGDAEVTLDAARRPTGDRADGPVGVLVLGHGASGGVDAPDLLAVRDAAVAAGLTVARVLQPYRVAGRRAPAPAGHLDAAFIACVAAIRERVGGRLPLVVGGRSAGGRVAARTAADVGAVGVLALAFPLHPPGRPDKTRAGELDPALPTLVVNGDADPFGVPEPSGAVEVVVRPGERHDLRRDPTGVAEVAVEWLSRLLSDAARRG